MYVDYGMSVCVYVSFLSTGCMYHELELVRYRYLESVSVFGIFVGIFFMSVRYLVSVSVFLKYWLKITNFWYTVPHLYLAPLLRGVISQSGPLLEN